MIEGRKKELLKTAYGKYLNPTTIESRLRGIPGLTNVIVVGEARPFCAALVWVDGTPTGERCHAVAAAIEEIGRSLSHPEQVKRWGAFRRSLGRRRGPDADSNSGAIVSPHDSPR